MNAESTVHWGDYGGPNTREKNERDHRGARSGKPFHQSLTNEELTDWFIVWGIVGKRRQINPVIRLMPYFDRGPGIDHG